MHIITLINAKRAFSNYLDAKMPPALAYKIMTLVRAAETEEAFYQKELQKLIEQYGKRNADGSLAATEDGNVLLSEDTLQECRQKVDELEALDVDAPNISFTLDELSCVSMTVREMNAISVFISDDGQA
jgi:predicted ATPase